MQDERQYEQLILQYNQLKNGAEDISRMLDDEDYDSAITMLKAREPLFASCKNIRRYLEMTPLQQKTDDLIAKVGAGGLCVVLNIKEKQAFALKINDCSYDARRIALFETINRLGWGRIEYDKTIKTIAGKVVGEIVTEFG